MAGRNDTFKAEIELNAKQAKSELKQLEDQQKRMIEQQKALYSSSSSKNKQLARDMQKDIDNVNAKIREQKKYISGLSNSVKDLSQMSYKELNQTVRALNKELRSGHVERGSKDYKILAERVKACRAEMEKMNAVTKSQPSLISRVSEGVNKYAGVVAGVVASISGLTMTIRKCVSDFADMDEEMVDVQKYTGMTKQQVVQLNEEFKKMDTRTSREQLNQLADDAGRLGLQTQESVQSFVDAADKINVALGDDLGDDAVDQIGKMAMAFGEDKKHGLNKAMLATGSVVNELSQSSSASGGYLVQFAARMAGVGKQAGLTIPQIMSFGSVLDQNMQEVEVSATSLNQLITAMFKEPAKFAQLAGMDVKKFTKLLKTDANQALLEFLATMKNTGGFDKLAPMFDQMGLSGSRSVQVLSVLANKLTDVVAAENTANDAYEKGDSVLNEFNRANESAQAQLDKAKKHFHDLSVELGEQLMPVVRYTISGASLLVRALSAIVPWLKNNIGLIARLAIVIGSYYTATKIAANWTKVLTIWQERKNLLTKTETLLTKGATIVTSAFAVVINTLKRNTQAATVAQTELNTATKMNPWGLVISLLTAAGLVLYDFIQKLRESNAEQEEARKKQKELAEAAKRSTAEWRANAAIQKDRIDIDKQVAESTAEERTRVEELNKAVHNSSNTIDERRKAIKTLQQIVPDYHASITKEGKLYNDNVDAINRYIQGLNDAAEAEAIYARKVQINEEKQRLEWKKNKKLFNIKKVDEEMDKHPDQYKSAPLVQYDKYGNKRTVELNVNRANKLKERGVHEKEIKDTDEQLKALDEEDKWLDKRAQQRKQVKDRLHSKLNNGATYGNSRSNSNRVVEPKGGTSTYVDHKALKKQQTLEKQVEAKRKEKEKEEERKRKEALKKAVDEAKAEQAARNAFTIYDYTKGSITYSQYLNKMHESTEKYYAKLATIYGKDSDEYKKLLDDKAKAEQEYQDKLNEIKKNDLEIEHIKKQSDIKSQYYDISNEKMYQNEEALNEALFQEDQDYIKRQQALYGKGSKEWHSLELQRTKSEEEHKVELKENYEKKIYEYRKEMGKVSLKEQEEAEINGVQFMLDAMAKAGEISEVQAKAQFKEISDYIHKKYKELGIEQKVDNVTTNDVKTKAATKLDQAKKLAGVDESNNSPSGDDMATGVFSIFSAIKNQKLVNDKLKELYGEDYENNKEYQEAKKLLNQETNDNIIAGATVMLSGIANMLSAASSYAQACSDLETAKITANYQKQIDAAGNNSKKKERLEKKRDKELAKAKTKANKKAMKIEIAQALASTALAAINAYASGSKINVWLGPVAAAMATAAGMIQIATIKKQHQAEEAGYYEGGYTKGNRYHKEAGVVHEGEFVANHQAVNNRQIAPVFTLLDNAQRNNRVASLTADDVTHSLGRDNTQVVSPVITVTTDNKDMVEPINALNSVIDMLQAELHAGIHAKFEPEGFDRDYKHYLRLKGNPK